MTIKIIAKGLVISLLGFLINSCASEEDSFDAQGSFTIDELYISSEVSAKILKTFKKEGDYVKKGDTLAILDAFDLSLQKEQIQTNISVINDRLIDVEPQIQVLEEQLEVQNQQLDNLNKEQDRFKKLVENDAAPRKQLEDIVYQIKVLNKQITTTKSQILLQKSTTSTQNKTILTQKKILYKNLEQAEHNLNKTILVSPIEGRILNQYFNAGEFVQQGKGVFTVGNTKDMFLKAYVTGKQLINVKLGKKVKVFHDNTNSSYKEKTGKIVWIGSQSEFTPKTIQTKDERENLVYPIKIAVENLQEDIKIGMFGYTKF